MQYLTFKFSNNSLCPEKGTYFERPRVEKKIPNGKNLTKIELRTCKDETSNYLYAIEFFWKDDSLSVKRNPANKFKHHNTHEISLLSGERIVAAMVEITGFYLCKITFLVYDLI